VPGGGFFMAGVWEDGENRFFLFLPLERFAAPPPPPPPPKTPPRLKFITLVLHPSNTRHGNARPASCVAHDDHDDNAKQHLSILKSLFGNRARVAHHWTKKKEEWNGNNIP